MHQDSALIALVAVGFVLACGFGFLANRVRLPPIVGYLLAGVAVGPFTPGFVGDAHIAGQLAEIGVMLLMFGVGLHFSLDTLLAVKNIAIPGAIAQIVVATAIGTGLAVLWGWDVGAGLVLGLALSVASTVVLLRALEQHNELDSPHGRIAVGWLIVEDLATVLALVFLPALAAARDTSGAGLDTAGLLTTLGVTVGKIALFIALVLFGGRRVVPWLLEQVARTGSRELFTLAVLAIALGMAYGSAALFDVSFALGAFFAGVLLSESELSHQAAADSLPLQDAFAVLFFVSVGMLFDPTIIVREPLAVLSVLLVVVAGKSLAAFLLVLLFRHPVATALTVSASLAQIGEFSFILVGLGVSLQLLPAEGRDLVLAVSLLSITLNPFVFATITPVTRWIRARPKLCAMLERGATRLQTLPEPSRANALRDHAILVGFGRVGSMIGATLARERLPYVVIERDLHLVESLRERGIRAIYGDASAAGVMDYAGLQNARLLIVASPDSYAARRIVELARKVNSRIDILVRTHNEHELEYFEKQGVGRVMMGERELALGMTQYALQSLGVPPGRSQLVTEGLRAVPDGQ
ncbi:MAG TPA: YbaL family putative K(+) efflux transporter [Steroidobacteraceae bacterium]|nr:YbaL family putative K(+) efflux transporter [Steroidobacteraceae bacterium]